MTGHVAGLKEHEAGFGPSFRGTYIQPGSLSPIDRQFSVRGGEIAMIVEPKGLPRTHHGPGAHDANMGRLHENDDEPER
jgi:hypothetical protein